MILNKERGRLMDFKKRTQPEDYFSIMLAMNLVIKAI